MEIQLVDDRKNRTPLESIGNGSTAHEVVPTGADGIAKFLKVPKNKHLRAVVINPPPGSIQTTVLKDKDLEGEDSDLLNIKGTYLSTRFSVNKFGREGVYGSVDLGFKMPKTMVVRAWDDANENVSTKRETEKPQTHFFS